MKRIVPVLILVVCITHANFAQLTGKVISIADGDTFTMMVNNESIRVRLHGIDCPEKGQDFSKSAKEFLSHRIATKTVSVKKMDTDRYGRIIGIVTIDTINLNESLLKRGLAWHYKQYDENPVWAKFEEQARKQKIGLWSLAFPLPPWEFRKSKKQN